MLGLPYAKIGDKVKKGKNIYSDLDSKSKTAVNIATALGALGVLFAGYKIISGFGDILKTATGQKWNEERKAKESKEKLDLNKELSNQGENPTFNTSTAKNIANGLYQAFLNTQPEWSANLWDEGTDESAIYAALKLLKNKSDWLLISREYGMPRGRNLASELSYELSTGEMQKIREILSKINVTI